MSSEFRSFSCFQHCFWVSSSTEHLWSNKYLRGHSNSINIFNLRELSLSAYREDILKESESRTRFDSQMTKEHVRKFTHHRKTAGERLIGERHVISLHADDISIWTACFTTL